MLAVKTTVFEGPLDLLLHLIEREDLDITAVSLIQVTDQYISALRSAEQIDLRALAEFVAVCAKLLLLKSRALLPRTPTQAEEDELEAEGIAHDLTEQLEEYRVYKSAASYLKELEETGHRSYVRIAPVPLAWLPTGLEDITMRKLLDALSQAIERLPVAPPPERLQRALINIAERRQMIIERVRHQGRISFVGLVSDCRTRVEAVVCFLAVLDLLKTEELVAEQSDSFGEIFLHGHRPSPHAATTA